MDEQRIIEEIKERRKKETFGRMRIAAEYGLTQRQAQVLVRKIDGKIKTTIPTIMDKNKGLSIEQLRSKHDNHFIIQKSAEKLTKDYFLTESEFKIECNFAANAGYKDAMSHPEFSKYKGRAGGTTYWGHPDSIKKLKDESVLKDA